MGIEIRGMAPLLQVFDMPAASAFYRDVLGFEVVSTSTPREEHFDWALLRLNGVELMLNTAYEQDSRPPEPDPARIAAHDDTAIFFGCPDVDAAYAYLRSRGQNVREPKVAPHGMKQLYVRDPIRTDIAFAFSGKRGSRLCCRVGPGNRRLPGMPFTFRRDSVFLRHLIRCFR